MPKFTREQKEYLRDFINNKLVPIQYFVEENHIGPADATEEEFKAYLIADDNIKLISEFLKNLEE